MQILLMCMLFVVGSCVGSFVCCQARRLHVQTHNGTKKYDMGKRSVCMKCHYQLRWYDNIPVVSWIWLRGKCRKCGSKIGVAELLAEVGTGVGFLCAGVTIQIATAGVFDWSILAVNLVLIGVLAFLAVYDGLYGELPVAYLTISIICAIMLAILKEWSLYVAGSFSMTNILELIGAVAVLGGLYLVLYIVSKGKWVGDGDWLLGTAIGLALGKPILAMVALCVANVLACVVMMPTIKKMHDKRIHFGPFMVVAYVVTLVLAGLVGGVVF